MFGQSGTDRPEPVLVTRPPAKISTAVESRDEHREEMEQHASDRDYSLNVKATSFVSFAPIVTVCVCVPSFSCHASMV